MSKSLRQSSNNRKSQLLPQRNRSVVRAHHNIELHGTKTSPFRLAQAMHSHRPADAPATAPRIDHKSGIGHMRAAIATVGGKLIHSHDSSIFFRKIGSCARTKPEDECIFIAGFGCEDIGCSRRHNRLKYRPHRRKIRFKGPSNLHCVSAARADRSPQTRKTKSQSHHSS